MILGISNPKSCHRALAWRVALLAFALSLGAIATPTTAQVLHTLVSPNEETWGSFGYSVSGAGDVNGDGYADVVVGAYQENPGSSPENAGRAYVFNGQTGIQLYTLVSPNEEYLGYFGRSVSGAGDVNGDGYADVVVGAPEEDPESSPQDAGRAYVFDGQTGDLLHVLVSQDEVRNGSFGCSVSGAGDINGDGHDEVVVGASGESLGSSHNYAGRAYVFDGATGHRIYTLVSPSPAYYGHFGNAVSGAGDVNGDGYNDVVVGAIHEYVYPSPHGTGRAYVFDGQTGNPLHSLISSVPGGSRYFGCSVSGAGDVDRDGCADVIVGAHHGDQASGPNDAGRAFVFAGQTGDLLYTLVSPNEEAHGDFGFSVAGAGDINGDGYEDVVVGAQQEEQEPSPTSAGRAYVFDGQTGNPLYTLISPNEEDHGCFGHSVSGAGDVNGDGYDDVVIGAHLEDLGYSPSGAGRAHVFSGFLVPVELTGFTAAVESGKVILRWATLSEHENFGFHLYRHGETAGTYVRITDVIIPGAGNSSVRQN